MDAAKISALLPPFQDNISLIEKRQNVYSIIREIVAAHKAFAGDYDKIAAQFNVGSTSQICDALYRFCKNNIAYKMEPEAKQTTKSPAAILSQGFGDCKHYASFCGGVLDALNRAGKNIDWNYRFASYTFFTPEPEHVFVVVRDRGREKWIDPTPGAASHTPTWQIDKKVRAKTMALYRISGLGAAATTYPISDLLDTIEYQQNPDLYIAIQLLLKYGVLNAQAKVNDGLLYKLQYKVDPYTYEKLIFSRRLIQQHAIGGLFSSIWNGVKAVALAAPRNAFLGLVGLNFFGYATKLSKSLYLPTGGYSEFKDKLKSTWEKLGGNFSKLEATIHNGASKKAILGRVIAGPEAAALPAWVAVAAACVAAIMPLVNAFLKSKESQNPMYYGNYNLDPTTGLPYGGLPGGGLLPTATNDPLSFIKNNPALVAGGIAAFYLMSKK